MLVTGLRSASMLYDTISHLGMLCSEEKHIRMVREESNTDEYFSVCHFKTGDIDRVGYLYPHIEIKTSYGYDVEIWANGHYQHPDKTTWIEGNPYSYVVMNEDHDIETEYATVFYNPSILYRYHRWMSTRKENGYKHRVVIDIREEPYNRLEYPDRSAYYISDDQVKIPTVTWLDDYTIQFEAPYSENIDFFICSNLVGIFEAKANKGVYIDSPNSPVCWHHILVDGDPSYHIDARFYPCIEVDKDCIIRVFNDHFHVLRHPETCRLLNYPEFADVEDPYNTGVEYLRTLKEVDDVITHADTDPVIYQKFLRIARFCYRIWEKFPKFSDEVSDFIICDNHEFGFTKFKKVRISGFQEAFDGIYTTVPFEAHRDLLFYEGMLFSDYSTMQLVELDNGTVVESEYNGQVRYVIQGDYDPDKFTLIKFNSWEDTNIMNVGDYINEKLTLDLHTKLNNFYRNLMVVRMELLDRPGDDKVRVMTEQPTARDEYMWFELLVNTNPDIFKDEMPLIINLYGVNGELIPDTIKNGAYMVNLDPEEGPAVYTDLLMTFFELSESQKKYLALHYEEQDRTVGVYYDVTVGNADNPKGRVDGGLVIDDESMKSPYTEGTIDVGTEDMPEDSSGNTPGDLYAEVGDIGDLLDAPDNMDADTLEIGSVMLEDMTYQTDDGHITIDEFKQFSKPDKIAWIKSHINEVMDPDEFGTTVEHLLDADDETLNRICYKILQTKYIYDVASSDQSDTSSIEADVLSEETQKEIVQHNLKYIISEEEPDEKSINDIWIQLPEVDMGIYIKDVVSYELLETTKTIKKPHYDDSNNPIQATMALDFGANDESGLGGEIFQAEKDPILRPIHVGQTPPTEDEMTTNKDVWYEYLDETVDRVCYFDQETMILRVNERLMVVQFSHDNLTGFLFDDIVLNFRGKLGMKYLSILADLINSNVIRREDLNVFYTRLITKHDDVDPDLKRLYTGTSHVVSMLKADTSDMAVLYSTNIGRFTMHYGDSTTTNREREAAYRMCIDYSGRDFAFLTDRMLVFVNGKYIPREELSEEIAQCIQLLNFDEVITTVDIFYSMKDVELMRIKKSAYAYWPLADTSSSIQRPERDYDKMDPIKIYDRTKRGYYDILLDEFIFNGKLMRILNYLEDHPDEADRFKHEIVNQFHAISDLDLAMATDDDHPRIIIPGLGDNPVYYIQES